MSGLCADEMAVSTGDDRDFSKPVLNCLEIVAMYESTGTIPLPFENSQETEAIDAEQQRAMTCFLSMYWDNTQILKHLVLIFQRLAQFSLSEQAAMRYLVLDSRDSSIWAKLGLLRLKVGNIPGARFAALKSLEFSNNREDEAGGWLVMASIAEADSSVGSTSDFLKNAFIAIPALEAEYKQRLREAAIRRQWPKAVLRIPSGSMLDTHPTGEARSSRLKIEEK